MVKQLKSEPVDHLFEAILTLKSKEECYSFFEDLCTVNELLSLSQRFEVAAMLKEHKTYLEIAEKTGFENGYYFSTAFKKEVGLSPSEYRKTYII